MGNRSEEYLIEERMQGCAEVSETHNMLESSVAKHDARTIFRLLLSEFSNDVAEGGIGWGEWV